jgi:hypothetical protein
MLTCSPQGGELESWRLGVGTVGGPGVFEVRLHLILFEQFLEIGLVVLPIIDVVVPGKIQFFILILILFEELIVFLPIIMDSTLEPIHHIGLLLQRVIILHQFLIDREDTGSEVGHGVYLFLQVVLDISGAAVGFGV